MTVLFDCRAIDGLTGNSSGLLSRSGWVCSADRTNGANVPANAIDGSDVNGWWNGSSIASFDWFKIDCGAQVAMGGVKAYEASPNQNDMPGTGLFYTSDDDVTYTLIASHVATDYTAGILQRRFSAIARYLKWMSPGDTISPGNWWGISEINILQFYGVQPRVGSGLSWGGTTHERVANYTDPVSGLAVQTYPLKATDIVKARYTASLFGANTWFIEMYMDLSSAAAGGNIISGPRIWVIGDTSGGGGPSLRVFLSATGTFTATLHNGTTQVSGSTTALSWAAGDRIQLRIVTNSDGSIQTWGRVNGAAEASAGVSGALASGGAINQPFLTLGAEYTNGNHLNGGLVSLQSATGVLTSFLTTYTLTTAAGVFTDTGDAASLLREYLISASTRSYAFAGNNASLLKHYLLTTTAGAHVLAGAAAFLSRAFQMNSGVFAMSGKNETMARELVALVGDYLLTGNAGNLRRSPVYKSMDGQHSIFPALRGSVSIKPWE